MQVLSGLCFDPDRRRRQSFQESVVHFVQQSTVCSWEQIQFALGTNATYALFTT